MSHCFQQSADSSRYQSLCFKAVIIARRVRNVLSLDKTKLDAQIVYDAHFVCKGHHEILALLDSMVCI